MIVAFQGKKFKRKEVPKEDSGGCDYCYFRFTFTMCSEFRDYLVSDCGIKSLEDACYYYKTWVIHDSPRELIPLNPRDF